MAQTIDLPIHEIVSCDTLRRSTLVGPSPIGSPPVHTPLAWGMALGKHISFQTILLGQEDDGGLGGG